MKTLLKYIVIIAGLFFVIYSLYFIGQGLNVADKAKKIEYLIFFLLSLPGIWAIVKESC